MSLVGHRIGVYEVSALIGAGGMGEVYRARDSRLGRDVAVKVLPASFLEDSERRARFEREARILAALNHPHVAAIYGFEEADGVPALVLELVDGNTLAERLYSGPIRPAEALVIARQIAEALEAAHDKGIVHRDLKPANVKITPAGVVKVLDFGLAKTAGDSVAAAVSHSPTIPANATREGVLLGTAAYMSPEQARGQPVDRQTDIWAFGCVVYEMLTGHAPFGRETTSDTIAAILDREPDWAALPARVPPPIARLLRRCLDKDVRRRLRDIGDARMEVEEALDRGFERIAMLRRPRVRAAALGVAAVLIGGSVFLAWRTRSRAPSPRTVRATFAQLTSQPGIEWFPSLSPDGRWVVYSGDASGNRDIYLQSVTGQKPLNLTADSAADDDQPAFSPDGEQIAFRSERDGGGIFVMGRTGEAVRRVTTEGFRPSWSPDGTHLLFVTENVDINPQNGRGGSELRIVDLRNGSVRTIPDAIQAVHASWSPDGRRLAVSVRFAGSTQMDIATVPVTGGPLVPLVVNNANDWNAVWSADGRYLYYVSDASGSMNLWRIRVDQATGAALAAPEQLTAPAPFVAHPMISADGRHLAFSAILITTNVNRLAMNPQTATFEGTPKEVTTGSRPWSSPDPSPDGEWVTFYSFQNPQGHIYVQRADGTGLRQLTGDLAIDRVPRWSPDGQWIAFFSNRSGEYRLWKIHPDGSGLQEMSGLTATYAAWSPDGTHVATSTYSGRDRTPSNLAYTFDVRMPWSDTTPEMLPTSPDPSSKFVPNSWSADGLKLVGQTKLEPSGIAMWSSLTRTYDELTSSGEFPVWLPDNRTVLYVSDAGKYFRVVDARSKQTRVVFTAHREVLGPPRLTRDGRWAYFTRRNTESDIWVVTLADDQGR